jgi:mRNA interferase MazF
MVMQRGEVWWADLPAPVGRRPVVLLSRNVSYPVRTSVTVAPVTRTIRGIHSEVPLDKTDGMPARCVINLDDILTIPKNLVTDRLTTLTPTKMGQVKQAALFALGLEEVP